MLVCDMLYSDEKNTSEEAILFMQSLFLALIKVCIVKKINIGESTKKVFFPTVNIEKCHFLGLVQIIVGTYL